MLILTACVTATAFIVQPTKAGLIEDGAAAYDRGDYATAYELLLPQARNGDAFSQFRLGDMYRIGGGVARDFREPEKWYRRAAEQKHAGAQLYLGMMYLNGLGVPQDHVLAHMWFNIAAGAAKGFEDGKAARMLRDGLAEAMTPNQIAEAQHLARAWIKRHSADTQ